MLRIVLELTDGQTLVASRHGIDLPAQVGQQMTVFWEPSQAIVVEDSEEELP